MVRPVRSFFYLCLLAYSQHVLAKFYFASQDSSLSFLGSNSSLYLLSPMTGVDGTLQLKDNVAGTVSSATVSDTLTFDNGVLVTGVVSSVMSGTIDPAGTDSIVLANGDFLDVQSGVVTQAVSVAAGATATILGQPRFSSAIALGDASSVLQVSITTSLNQSVTGDGKLSLLDDLVTDEAVALPALVDNNGKKLTLYGVSYSSAVTFATGGSIELLTSTALTETWTIGTGTDVYHLNGNGCVLDLSSNGNIVFNGATLYINDLNIRGLSDTNALKGTGRIIMSNVVLELGGNFARTDGSFTFYGDPCKIIVNGSTFQISGAGNEILVDGVVLRYDQLDGSGLNPISAVSDGAINFLNGGQIQSSSFAGDGNLLIYNTSYTFVKNFALTASSNIQVINADPGTPKAVTVNGAGHSIQFPATVGSFFILNENVQLTLTNIVLKGYIPSAIGYGPSSTLTFGDGVVIELDSDVTIGATDPLWVFNGNATIVGKGAVMQLDVASAVSLTGAKTLAFEDIRLKTSVNNAVSLAADSTVKFKNSELFMGSAGYLFSAGSMQIDGFVKMTGNAGTSNALVVFEFASLGTMSVLADAELFVDSNVKFKYNADPTNDASLADTKRHFSLAQVGSKLTLNGCSLESTDTGLALDTGTVRVVDKVIVVATTSPGAEFEVGANLEMTLTSGAYLSVDGPMKYSE